MESDDILTLYLRIFLTDPYKQRFCRCGWKFDINLTQTDGLRTTGQEQRHDALKMTIYWVL